MSVPLNSIVVITAARLEYRDAVGAMVHSLCKRVEQSGRARPGMADEVLSAFNEAFNNVALHAGSVGGDQGCLCELELLPEKIILRLMDRGPGFDPESLPAPDTTDPSRLAEGGYGLYIMRSYMNEVRYVRGAEGQANVLTLVRHLEPGTPAREGEGC